MRLCALLLGAGALSCQPAPDEPTPVRLVDRNGGDTSPYLIIDGELKSILPPGKAEQRFTLVDAPTRPVLTFAAGLAPSRERGVVRFEALLEPKQGESVTLYSRDVDRPGWYEARIDLPARDLDGSTLVFRRSVRSGFETRPPPSGWGNPTLLPAAPTAKPSVILVSLDTLRADKLGSYGHTKARTPALDRLAAEGVQYERAYAPSTWTIPSHASLFYGAYLPDVPVAPRPDAPAPASSEARGRPVAAILRDAGYVTAAFTGGGFLGHYFNLNVGFESYFAYWRPKESLLECGPGRLDGAEVFRRAIEWLRANHGSPFFLFVHTYDIHDRCPFISTGAKERFAAMSDAERASQRRVMLEQYDGRIADTDKRIAGLLAAVDELGLRERTLIVLTSDHGEGFGEHEIDGHACDLKPYEELARVPMLLRFPGRLPEGERIGAPVSLIDVTPTLLALLGLPRGPGLQGALLPGLGLPGSRVASEPVYTHCGSELAVARERYKLVTAHDRRHVDEVYDLSRDPYERSTLGDAGSIREALDADAAGYWKTARLQPNAPSDQVRKQELDAEVRERLRALGYVD